MLKELQSFLAVAAAGSIQGAAGGLPFTQSAITRQIQRLEAELRCTLLDRSAKPPRLTPDGERVRAQGKLLLDQAETFRASLDPSAEPEGALRLGVAHAALDWGGGDAVARAVVALSRACPKVSARLFAGWTPGLAADLLAGRLDAAILIGRADGAWPAGLTVAPIASGSLVAVASKSLGLKPRAPLAALFEHAWILSPEGCGYRALLASLAAARGRPLHIGAEVHGASLHRELVSAGLGVGLVPHGVARRWRAMAAPGEAPVIVAPRDAPFGVEAALAHAASTPRLLRPIEAFRAALARGFARGR